MTDGQTDGRTDAQTDRMAFSNSALHNIVRRALKTSLTKFLVA